MVFVRKPYCKKYIMVLQDLRFLSYTATFTKVCFSALDKI